MNKTVNKILLAGDKFMPGMHLRLPRFTYNIGGLFIKNKEGLKKFKDIFIKTNEIKPAFKI